MNQLPKLSLDLIDVCTESPSFTLNQGTPQGGDYFINDIQSTIFDIKELAAGPQSISYYYTDTVNNCSNHIQRTININPSPIAKFAFSPEFSNLDNPNIFFGNTTLDIDSNVWNLGDGTIFSDSLEFWHSYPDTGTYQIIYTVRNQFNCFDSTTHTVIIHPVYQFFIPSAFSPNQDGDNELFYPVIIGGNDYTLYIYSRWGELIYEEFNGAWDGKVNNRNSINGVYGYTVIVHDFKDKVFKYTGILSLLR